MTETPVEYRRQASPMRALVFDQKLRLGHLPRPRPNARQVLVEVDACAISRADLDLVQGRRVVQVRPTLLGHQFVGRVVERGEEVDESWLNRRVIAQTVPGCRRCSSCRQGLSWRCEKGVGSGIGMGLVDGAFAECVVVDADSILAVGDDIDDEEATFAYPIAVALQALDKILGPVPQRVLVVGDGNMGLLITLLLHSAGHTVSVLGRHPSRREVLWRSGIGFTPVPDEALQDPETVTSRLGDYYSTIIECSGQLTGLELAARLVRPRGRVILVSDHVGQPGADLRFLVSEEAELVGVSGGPLQPALDLLSTRVLDVSPLVSARSALMDGISAFERASRRGTLRVILHGDGKEVRRASITGW